MKIIWILSILVTLLSFGIARAFSPSDYTSEAKQKITECLEARAKWTANAVEGVVCPQGEIMSNGSLSIPYTPQVVAFQVVVSLLFTKLDEETDKSMKELQNVRATDAQVWLDAVNQKIDGIPNGSIGIEEQYHKICAEITEDESIYGKTIRDTVISWTNEEAEKGNDYNLRIGSFPDTFCRDLAEKKTQAWRKLGYILAAQGSAKWYQNSKDKYMSSIKTKYDTLLQKVEGYKRIVTKAVSKFTKFIRTPVK